MITETAPITVFDFTTKTHFSCNGCYFQKRNCVTCIKVENHDLVSDLWKMFGTCLKKRIIYILKTK